MEDLPHTGRLVTTFLEVLRDGREVAASLCKDMCFELI